jgi:hypothetical protein
VGFELGKSSLLWSQQPNQSTFPGAGDGSWSWFNARKQYLDALTKQTKSDRDRSFADLFRSLGQGTHLLQDASVPAHVRNDHHLNREVTIPLIGSFVLGDSDGYEKWSARNITPANPGGVTLAPIAPSNSMFTPTNDNQAPVPVARLLDTDRYNGQNPSILSDPDVGITEYTNGNFLSKDTIFKDFTYPNVSQLLPNPIIDATGGKYYSRTLSSSETVPRFVREGLLGSVIRFSTGTHPPSAGWILDDKVHQDYSNVLLRRAVGYSASYLDHFFRGKLNIDLFSDSNDPSILQLKGTNESIDKIDGGRLELYAEDPNGDRTKATALDSTTLTADPGQQIASARFQAPPNAEKFVAVYKGKLGDEVPQGDFPGGVIGKTLGGVRVEEAFSVPAGSGTSRWYLRSPQGAYPSPILSSDIVEMQWGDDGNSLVARTRIGPNQPNRFYVYRVNRAVGSIDIPLRSPDSPLPDLPDANQIVDMELVQEVTFPFGIDTGTTVQFSHRLNYTQYLPQVSQTVTVTWDEKLQRYSDHPGFQNPTFAFREMTSGSQSFSTSFPVVLSMETTPLAALQTGARYQWYPYTISYTRDGKILMMVWVYLLPPREYATFPAFTYNFPNLDNADIAPVIVPQDPNYPTTLSFEKPEMGPALYALVDVTSGQIVANTAPATLSINHETSRPQFASVPGDPSTVKFFSTRFEGGPFSGHRWSEVGEASTTSISIFCPSAQLANAVELGQITVHNGNVTASANQYRSELNQLQFPPVGLQQSTRKFAYDCGNPTTGRAAMGFRINSTRYGASLSRIDDLVRTSTGSDPEQFAVLVTQRQNESDFARLGSWTPQQSVAEQRDQTSEEGFHFLWSTGEKASLLMSFPNNSDSSSRLVSLVGEQSTKVFPNQSLFQMAVLDPDYLYDTNALKFFTKDSTPQKTALPATLAPVGSNPSGIFHVLSLGGE